MGKCIFHDADPSLRDRRFFEIVERAYGLGERVLVYVPTAERAAAIDRVLWINKQEAFIPHEIVQPDAPETSIPVAIVSVEQNLIGAGILVADGHCSLEFASGFETVHEFVDRSSPRLQEVCRTRFRDYRARGFPVEYSK